jgi:hypothetical protein
LSFAQRAVDEDGDPVSLENCHSLFRQPLRVKLSSSCGSRPTSRPLLRRSALVVGPAAGFGASIRSRRCFRADQAANPARWWL